MNTAHFCGSRGCLVRGRGIWSQGNQVPPLEPDTPLPKTTKVGGTHLTGMLSCLHICRKALPPPPPRPCEQSNTCKNITYPQLRLRVVRKKYIKLEAKYENVPSITFFRALTHTRVTE